MLCVLSLIYILWVMVSDILSSETTKVWQNCEECAVVPDIPVGEGGDDEGPDLQKYSEYGVVMVPDVKAETIRVWPISIIRSGVVT